MSHRQSTYPIHTRSASSSQNPSSSATTTSSSTSASSTNRARQYAHLHASLAQLNAHLADMENLLRMTAVQAEYMRGLGGWTGGLFMAAAKVLGEEGASAVEKERGVGNGGATRGQEGKVGEGGGASAGGGGNGRESGVGGGK